MNMTYREAYGKGIEILKTANVEAPVSDAGVLLCHVASCDRSHLYAHGERELEGEKLEHYLSAVEKRAGGVPLQYLTGVQEFMSLVFRVGPGVLIPRQDTEVLVEMVMEHVKKQKHQSQTHCHTNNQPQNPMHILDIGTGSGCIAVSLAHYLPECRVTAIDKMPGALKIARANAAANGVAERICFMESDLFEELSGQKFHVIVSNPPYIRSEEIRGLQKEVRDHEPVTALDGGEDGLIFYRAIAAKAPAYLMEGGMLAFETGYDQAADVAALLSESFHEIHIRKDLSGTDRVVTALLR